MKEIFKTFKNYIFAIVVVIVLLVVQALCELQLPKYTSDIVNIGIQQKGIEAATFEVIRESEFNNLLLFTDYDDVLLKDYSLVTAKDKEYLDDYPLLKKENLYVINDNLTDREKEEINDIVTVPLFILYNMSINEGVDLNIDINDKDQYLKLNKEIEKLEPTLINQCVISYIQNEYELVGLDLDNTQINYIIDKGIKMCLLALLSMIVAISTVFLSSKIATGFSKNLRSKLVNKIMTYSNKEFEEFSVASLITRCTNDINQVQLLIIMVLRFVIYAPILGIGAYYKVSGNEMSWVIGVAILSISFLLIILLTVAIPKFNVVQKKLDKLNLVARETLTGMPVIRAFANEKHEEKRFSLANKDLTKVNLFVNRVMAILAPSMLFVMNGIGILIVWVGATKVDLGTMQVGTVIAFMSYAMQIIISFLMISMLSIMGPRAIVSFKRIKEVFNKESSVKEKLVTKPIPNQKCIIEFKDVYFRYPDAEEDVLEDLNFKCLPGTTTSFIGSTGSGKSTLINLIPRFFDVTGGKILINGIDIRDFKLHDLRSKIGYVPQKGMLFKGTIKSNIEFGTTKLGKEKLDKYAKISQSSEFISDKDKKFLSEVTQLGTNVSGGQRQRLAIARAMAVNPKIYIFDDSFSALDYKTDSKLRTSLKKEMKDSTILIVAQRISTVLNSDQIVVLEDGKIVGIGTHQELMKKCSVYKEIAYSQLSKEEIEDE